MKSKQIIVIFLIAFILRFIIFIFFVSSHPERLLEGDASGYDKLAVNLIYDHTFSRSEKPPFFPETLRTPLYPIFLAGIYTIFGHKLAIALFFQLFIGSLIPVIIYRIAQKLLNNKKVGFIAGLLVAIDIPSVVNSNFLLSETLFTLLLIIGIYSLCIFVLKEKKYYLISSGFFVGLTTLCRPISLYLPIFIVVFILIHFGYRKKFAKGCVSSTIFVIIFFTLIGVWIFRNYRLTSIHYFSTASASSLLICHAAQVIAEVTNTPFKKVVEQLVLEENYASERFTIFQSKRFVKRAKEIISKHPFIYSKFYILGMIGLFKESGRAALFRTVGLYSAYEGISFNILVPIITIWLYLFMVICYLFGVYGVYKLWKDKNYLAISVLSMVIGYFVIVSSRPLEILEARFRVPIIPYIYIFSSYGFTKCYEILKKIIKERGK